MLQAPGHHVVIQWTHFSMSALSLALGRPKLDTGLEIQFHEFQIEGRNHFTGHTSYLLSNAAECAVGLFDCRSAL